VASVTRSCRPTHVARIDSRESTALWLMEHYTGAAELFTTLGHRDFWAALPSNIRVNVWNARNLQPVGLAEWALMVAPGGPCFDRTRARHAVKKGHFRADPPRGKYQEAIAAAYSWLQDLRPEAPEITEIRADVTKNYTLVDDLDESLFVQLLTEGKVISFDIETTGLNPRKDSVVGISFSWEPFSGVYIRGEKLPPIARAVLSSPGIPKIAHNGKFDYKFLASKGVVVNNLAHDTQIMAYLLQLQRLKLKDLGTDELDEFTVHFDEIVPEGGTFLDVPEEMAVWYACQDADLTLRLYHHLLNKLAHEGRLLNVYSDIEIPLIPILAHMELAGAPVSPEAAKKLADATRAEVEVLEKSMWELAGQEFDPNSAQDLGFILYQKLGLQPRKENKTGYSTDKFVLDALKDEHALVSLILEWRKRSKLLSTYLDPIVNAGGPRVHGDFNQTVTATGRLSSSRPNLQNQDPVSRTVYMVEQPRILLAADYSQQELRILTHLSQDPHWLAMFRNGIDPHQVTAEKLGIPRKLAKNVNFGIPYGAGAGAIARQGKCSIGEAQEMLDAHKRAYPVLWEYLASLRELAHENGFAETIWGRRRYLPKIYSRLPDDVASAEREAVNMPIQGSAADITKLAMVRLATDLAPWAGICRLILQVHDELVFEIEEEEALEALIPIIEKGMQEADGGVMTVPLLVEAKHGRKWSDLK
jgi:DNA polymerase-1